MGKSMTITQGGFTTERLCSSAAPAFDNLAHQPATFRAQWLEVAAR